MKRWGWAALALLVLLAAGLADAQLPQLTCCNGSGSGSGGLAQGSGTTIADEQVVRGDTSGVQGSGVTLTDAALLRWGTTASEAGIKPSGGGSALWVRKGDDSAFGDVRLLNLEAHDGSARQALLGATAGGFLKISSTGGIYWNSSSGTSAASDVSLLRNGPARLKVTDSLTGTGVILGAKGADVASATNISLGAANFFKITGTTTINTIATTDWTAGSTVVLQCAASVTITHNGAGTGAAIFLAGAANFSCTADDTLTLIYNGTQWVETARTAI
jgi:fibronectin-binding autotransporter adhesin